MPAGGALQEFRLIPTRANRQPALAIYRFDSARRNFRAFGLLVLTIDGEAIAEITAFHDLTIFPLFGLPAELEPTHGR